MEINPCLTGSKPRRLLIKVDFPAPLRPTSAQISCLLISIFIDSENHFFPEGLV